METASSTDLTDAQSAAVELLRESQRVILTGHVRPDGDCIGAQAALCRVLEALGKTVFILNADPVEPRYDYLSSVCRYGVDEGGALPQHDLVVLLDCSELERTGSLAARFEESDARRLVIDHHILQQEEAWDAAFHDQRASATGLLVARVAQALGVELDEVAARGVFTSLVTDTGWFKYSNTDAETLALASRLVRGGVDPDTLFRAIYQRQAPEHPRYVGAALERTRYFAGGRLALVDLPQGVQGVHVDLDSDDVLDLLRSVASVEVVLLVREVEKGLCKVSARSKTGYDVNALMRRFGGGGHAKASGATIEGELGDVYEQLVAAATARFEEGSSSNDASMR